MEERESSCEVLERLYLKFRQEFGDSSAGKIYHMLLDELWGKRITISLSRYQQRVRNQKIRDNFHGDNHRELAIRYGLTESQIRKILRRGDIY